MKKTFIIITVVLSIMIAWWYGFIMQDGLDAINALTGSFMDYILPPQEGFKSYVVSGYVIARSYMGRLFGWQPLSIYDYMLDRAKANPLEAFGAVSFIVSIVWLIIFKYRMVYRFYHWLLMPRDKH